MSQSPSFFQLGELPECKATIRHLQLVYNTKIMYNNWYTLLFYKDFSKFKKKNEGERDMLLNFLTFRYVIIDFKIY